MLSTVILLPLALALLVVTPALAGIGRRLAPLAALPALIAGLAGPGPADQPWILLGLELKLDTLGRALLLLTGTVWTLAAWQASQSIKEGKNRFWFFWLVTLAGTGLVFSAGDAAGFYAGYVTMTLAAYGLVVHAATPEAIRAGRVYLVLALAGEALILGGLLQLAATHGNANLAELPGLLAEAPLHASAGWLMLAGFAVKMGLAPLHVWLPLAHPVAPVPASAILSGILVKAGLLGWLRLVPPVSLSQIPDPGLLVCGVGLATSVLAALAGLTQLRPKVVLAYSTISQMGLIAAAFGLALAGAATASLFPLFGLLVLHHGINKAALFLAAGSPGDDRRLWLAGLAALSLAGLPLTSGFLAKYGLKELAELRADWIGAAVTATSLTTTLILTHLLVRMKSESGDGQARTHPALPLLVALGLALPWVWVATHGLPAGLTWSGIRDGLWPLLAGLALAWAASRIGVSLPRLPEGDLVVAGERMAAGAAAWLRNVLENVPAIQGPGLSFNPERRVEALEAWLSGMPRVGLVLLGLAATLWWLLVE